MSETIDYEAMKAELEANGYYFDTIEDETYNFTLWAVYTPSPKWECHYTSEKYKEMDDECKSHLVKKAYAHYQEKKRYAAMEALLTELVQESDTYSLWLTGEKVEGITNLELDLEINVKLLQKAKAILGKGE